MPNAATRRYDWVTFSAASPSPAGTRVTHNRLVCSSLLPVFESLYVCGVSGPECCAPGAPVVAVSRAHCQDCAPIPPCPSRRHLSRRVPRSDGGSHLTAAPISQEHGMTVVACRKQTFSAYGSDET
jgi:hypothetical protein